MIIWGSRGREIVQSSGEFYCPECNSEQKCENIRVATYFTLYFIPIFETKHHGNFIKCFRCKNHFKMAVLGYKPPTDTERMLHSVRADLESGTPVQMARTKLLNAGIDAEAAQKLVTVAAGEKQVGCETCNLAFVEGITRCSSCGGAL